MAPRKALPWRPARGASPRAARPALPAAAPAGAKRNQWVQGERTTPRALGAVAKSHWLGTPGGCGLGHGGRGHQGGQQTKTVLLGPARAAQGRGIAVGTLRPGAGNLPTALCKGRRTLCLDPGAPHGVWMRLSCSTSSSLPVSWGHCGEHTWNAGTLQGLRYWTQLVVKVRELLPTGETC